MADSWTHNKLHKHNKQCSTSTMNSQDNLQYEPRNIRNEFNNRFSETGS